MEENSMVNKPIAAAAAAVALMSAAVSPVRAEPVKNVVLVHGAFADGSGWRRVADILGKDGYAVSIVQIPGTSLADDVAATNRVLDRQSGPAVLVGHSYGGVVITEAGNNAHVASLVYVAAYVPDEGEKLGTLLSSVASAANSIGPTADGYLMVDQAKFPADFAADLPVAEAQFMAISQVPINAGILGTPITAPAWKTKPSYGIVATQDRMINPDLERSMYKRAGAQVTEIEGSHAVFISKPNDVARLIEQAAKASAR
jgi:pimeloyl-ACP methyl ester carboxylesterase